MLDTAGERGRLATVSVGTELRIRSQSAGRDVQGVVTDFSGNEVKVMYFLGGKCCFKTVSKREYDRQLHESGTLLEEGPIPRRWPAVEEPAPAPAPAPAAAAPAQRPQARGEEAGPPATSTAPGALPTPEAPAPAQGAAAPDFERGRSTARSPADIAVGTAVQVRSASVGRNVQGVITDVGSDRVMVQYFVNGRCCMKAMPISSTEFIVSPQEAPAAQAGVTPAQ